VTALGRLFGGYRIERLLDAAEWATFTSPAT